MGKRERRKFSMGFKQQVVAEIASGLVTTAQAARKYEISASVIDRWRGQQQDGQLVERPTTEGKALQAENERLKAKIGELTMQIDLLKKLDAYAQRQRNERTSVITAKNVAQFQGGAK
jgi:transposase